MIILIYMKYSKLIMITVLTVVCLFPSACRNNKEKEIILTYSEAKIYQLKQTGINSSVYYQQSQSSFAEAKKEEPTAIRLKVPFSPQAPFADWEDPRQQEGCEEMSAIMVHNYLEKTDLSKEQALDELLQFSVWQTENNYPLDVSLQELAENIQNYYQYKTVIDTKVTVENIKKYISSGYPVIIPAAGRKLGNPYFSGEGPWYHMLVIIGYDNDEFVTNDPGTRRGEGYRYKYNVLLNAVHNWTGIKEEIENGEKVMLVVMKEG